MKLSSEKRTVSLSTKSVLKLTGSGENVTLPRPRLALEALDAWMLRLENVACNSAATRREQLVYTSWPLTRWCSGWAYKQHR